MNPIGRHYSSVVLTAGSSAGTTSARFAYGPFGGGGVIIASTEGATQISWYAASGPESTPVQIYAAGAPVTSAVTVGALQIPDEAYGFTYVAPIVVGATALPLAISLKG